MTLLALAGGEAWAEQLLGLGVKSTLYSFYYFRNRLRNMGPKTREIFALLRRAKEAGYFLMLDSGAFTYQVKGENKAEASKLPTPKVYFEEYYSFLKEYGDLFNIIAELDIDGYAQGEDGTPFSTQQVDEWTNKLLELPVIGTRILPVYHLVRGKMWLRDWLADTSSPYIGFASSAGGGGPPASTIALAHRFGKWVHGFGQTRIKTDAKYMPFNSVDSTSVSGSTLVWAKAPTGLVEYTCVRDLYASLDSEQREIGPHLSKLTEGYETLTLAEQDGQYKAVWAPLHCVTKHAVKKRCFGLTFEGGEEVIVTEDHSLYTMSQDGELVPVEPQALNVGDWVVAATQAPWAGQGVESMQGTHQVLGPGGRLMAELASVLELDEDMLLFLGLWIAEGSYCRKAGVWITNSSPETLPLVERIAERWGKLCAYKKGVNGISHQINSPALAQLMRQCGFVAGARNKRLPSFFWSLSEAQAKTFLRGMYSGDGGLDIVRYGAVNYHTISRILAKEVQAALLCLVGGPVCLQNSGHTKGGNYDKFLVAMTAQPVKQRFMQEIGVFQEYRKDYVFPPCKQPGGNKMLHGLPMSLARTRIMRPKSRGLYVREETDRVGRWALDAAPQAFHPLVASEGVCYKRIIAKWELPLQTRWMYDLSVEGTERFLANPLILFKNTWMRADRYGGSCYFINGKFIVLDHKHKQDRARYRDYYLKWGLDPKLIMKDDLYENRKATIIAWRELANDMERRVTHGTREPYLCEYLRKHGRMPDRHPLLVQTAARMQNAQSVAI